MAARKNRVPTRKCQICNMYYKELDSSYCDICATIVAVMYSVHCTGEGEQHKPDGHEERIVRMERLVKFKLPLKEYAG